MRVDRAAVEATLVAWLDAQLRDNPAVVAVERDADPDLHRWYVRMRGEERDYLAVWLTVGDYTLAYEVYVMPAPEENIAAGTRYFRQLLNRFDDQRIALAAYNAGPTKVERFGGVPPFPETQPYIEKVNRRHNRLRDRVRNSYVTMRMANVGN